MGGGGGVELVPKGAGFWEEVKGIVRTFGPGRSVAGGGKAEPGPIPVPVLSEPADGVA